MEPYIKETGIVAPLDRTNVDTDQIIPKQFLKKIERTGFGEFLFFDWRYNDDGSPNPDFILNLEKYKDATILLTRDNFGSGSSREHAPWALKEYGFKTIIAPSFADIFYNNCFKNSILPVELDKNLIEHLFGNVHVIDHYKLTIDLEAQEIYDDFEEAWNFEIDSTKKEALLNGIDDITKTLQLEENINKHEAFIRENKQWKLPRQS
ncbi:MAG: 3-isopropylmalate dehydratase small subunit [Thermodesulfobacteriota bacterium]